MLTVLVAINTREIARLDIQNIDHKGGDIYEYKIVNPPGFEDEHIFHTRKKGWIPLVREALNIVEKHSQPVGCICQFCGLVGNDFIQVFGRFSCPECAIRLMATTEPVKLKGEEDEQPKQR